MKYCTNRNQLIKTIPVQSIIVEVGVFEGEFADIIWNTCLPKELHLIDKWNSPSRSGDSFGRNSKRFSERETKLIPSILRDKYPANVYIHQGMSDDVMLEFKDNYIDAVYIDADHSFRGCLTDLCMAYQKVRFGGMIMGHDYNKFSGVTKAVDLFVKIFGLQINIVTTQEPCVSYCIYNYKKT